MKSSESTKWQAAVNVLADEIAKKSVTIQRKNLK